MKKILILAFVSAAFIFGCSADGPFNGNATPPEWKSEPSVPGGGGGGGDGPGPSTCPSSSNPSGDYCYYDGDCDRIGGFYTSSVAQCTLRNGLVITRQQCLSCDAEIWD